MYYYNDEKRHATEQSREEYQKRLTAAGFETITTEIAPAPDYYFAEDYHQQYLAKNPHGYCGHGGTGVSCPVGVLSSEHRYKIELGSVCVRVLSAPRIHPLETARREACDERAQEHDADQHEPTCPRLTMPIFVRRARVREDLHRQ